MQLIGIGGYCFFCIQYYYNLFNKCKHEVRILIRDFSYVLFYGVIGISLSSLVKIIYLKKHRKKSIFFTLIILYLLKDFDIIIKKCFYLRCAIFVIGSVSLFILFSMLLFDGKNNEKNNFIIKNMTNYTGGIYYLHTKINKILSGKLLLMKNKTFIGCILNYLLCYSICFLGIKTLGKTKPQSNDRQIASYYNLVGTILIMIKGMTNEQVDLFRGLYFYLLTSPYQCIGYFYLFVLIFMFIREFYNLIDLIYHNEYKYIWTIPNPFDKKIVKIEEDNENNNNVIYASRIIATLFFVGIF